ncbi:hypothetical protein Bhyg_13618 [Pseudolycoriella hygida]|uniref:Uncharacterized protein n=1 Tax=Pseudolycoriella hygida TaxID=35572 RepID=A0A9Q0RWI0_9DIPT|nr:hypothetical protein Bhyg_13618 [Pseudolycoriella hygida]
MKESLTKKKNFERISRSFQTIAEKLYSNCFHSAASDVISSILKQIHSTPADFVMVIIDVIEQNKLHVMSSTTIWYSDSKFRKMPIKRYLIIELRRYLESQSIVISDDFVMHFEHAT